MESSDLISQALQLAVVAHGRQIDKSGAPYILHVLDVWRSIRSADFDQTHQIVAILHDVVEDSPYDIAYINELFGERIAKAIDAISKRKGETREQYLLRVKADPIATAVKIADSADNYRRIVNLPDAKTRERLTRKYEAVFAALNPTQPKD